MWILALLTAGPIAPPFAPPFEVPVAPEPVAPVPVAPEPATRESVAVELSYRAFRRFEFELPDEVFEPVGDGIPIAHAGGDVFAVRTEGANLRVDVAGDGTFAAVVEPPPVGEQAVVTLRGTGADGERVLYCARLRRAASGWVYSCSGGLVGNLGATKFVLLDQDLDGVYGEPGEDAIVVGRGRSATAMGTVLLVDGALHAARYEDGALVLEPYTGPTGTLDLLSGFETDARPLSLRVSDDARNIHLDLARHDEGAPVPVGRYVLDGGQLASGDNRVTIVRGRMEPLEVAEGERTAPRWGGPIRAEFEYARAGTRYTFSPDAVWYYGRAGEQYVDWTPLGASPKFVIVDASDRAELVSGVFPGS